MRHGEEASNRLRVTVSTRVSASMMLHTVVCTQIRPLPDQKAHTLFPFHLALRVRAKSVDGGAHKADALVVARCNVDMRARMRVREQKLQDLEISKDTGAHQAVSDELLLLLVREARMRGEMEGDLAGGRVEGVEIRLCLLLFRRRGGHGVR